MIVTMIVINVLRSSTSIFAQDDNEVRLNYNLWSTFLFLSYNILNVLYENCVMFFKTWCIGCVILC